jgi:hypothetical protein
MSKKVLTVATAVQAAVFAEVLLGEISTGFWKNARPADHADYWKGVDVVVGVELGATGFEVPRNYNFVNPDFFTKNEAALLAEAQKVEPEITVKQLKKQLISLNQIIGARLKEVGGSVTKLPRGRKATAVAAETTVATTKADKKTTTTRRAQVKFVEPVAETVEA